MSGFPWTSFFISAGPVVGALGGIWIKGRQDNDRELRQAEEARRGAQADRRRGTYADFVTTTRLVLRNQRQLRIGFATSVDTTHQRVQDVFVRGSGLLDDLNRALVAVALLGSDESRTQADAVFDAVRTCSDILTAHSSALYAHQTGAASSIPAFPVADLTAAMNGADAALDAFVDAVRPELSPVAPPGKRRVRAV